MGEFARVEHDLDSFVAQDPEAAAVGVLTGIIGGDHHPRDPGVEDRLRARRRTALMAARLERHVQRRLRGLAAARGLDRFDLGVRGPRRAVKALADHAIALRQHGADQRVGAHLSAALLSELDRACEVATVYIGAAECHLGLGE